MYFEGNNRIYMAGEAWLIGAIRQDIEVATSEWAKNYMVPNQANSYLIGQFVEADRANNNKQYFKLGDLLVAQPTISYAPLNVNHEGEPVGAFVASEMQYPKSEDEHPYIETLAAMWKHYYPKAYEAIQKAYAEKSLFLSMEAVPQSLSTIGGSDDTAEYAYEGRTSKNYPDEINERSCEAIVLNNPHFVGGAAIIPPARPGWSKADVKQLSHLVEKNWERAEAIYSGVQEMAPELDSKAWEIMMGELILMANEDAKVLTPKARNALKPGDFAIPDKRAYPIQDLAHARNALARVAQFGTPEEQKIVRSKVYARFPQLKK